jgi:mono/diheme cytochrome c family protein
MPHLSRTANGRTLALCALFSGLLFLAGSAAKTQSTKPKIKEVPCSPTSAASGEEMYKSYCAACHGAGGKGDGPAAGALKGPVPDLTTLAQANGGKYPATKVQAVLRMGTGAEAHGSPTMPVWGPVFGALGGPGASTSSEVQLRIHNLTQYIGTLQVP